ncbi:MAG TPA: selenium-dependent xanthine dehydrogenase [Dongiaceae bacterium]|nr:selenium-dependent xanthine dehydrogenase [Dongiaceae bacterium]
MPITLTLNGRERHAEPREDDTLLDLLRGPFGLISPKRGCSPHGQCGACVVLVDGAPQAACRIPATAAGGRTVVTLEGLPEAARERYARAFVAGDALQCGFCTPGILVRVHHLLTSDPHPTRGAIVAALQEHLCRCTGYLRIVAAVESLARGEVPGAPGASRVPDGVGAPLERYGGRALALGERAFVDDLARPGLLHGALVFSPHPRARVEAIDTRAARALPGVIAVVTAADVPGTRWNGLIHDDWPLMAAVGEEVRCVGDVVAAVAAVDEATARRAAGRVRVRYRPLPPVLDPDAALADGAPQVHPDHPNRLSHSVVRRGDAAGALATSAHVVRGVWRTQRIEHLFLEPECALAEPDGRGGLRLWTAGQGIFDDRRAVARILGLAEERIAVTLVPSGGAFGGKEDLSVQGHAALLAWATGRPVKVALARAESIRMHPKRHPVRIELTAGCDAEGHLTAVWARMVGDTGAYASVGMKVLERAAGHACGPYRVPHVDVESLAVTTHNPPCGAMRGFGVPQAAFAIEGALDQLAARCGLDRWEIRWRNAVAPGEPLTTGQPAGASCGIRATLEAVRDRWYEWTGAGRAVGIACGLKNTGLGNGVVEWGKARLVVESEDSVAIHVGYTEMGQGLLTVLTQFAAEVTGLPAAVFRPRVDTTFALGCGQTTGSRATLFAGNAVVGAARRLRAALDHGGTLASLIGRVFAADVAVDDTTALGSPGPVRTHTSYGYATQLALVAPDGRIERVVAATDVGRAVNPKLVAGQIEGAVHMGLGYALTEELPCANGMPVTTSLYQLGVLRARDMPAVETILVESPEPEGPFGAKGIGELGLVPTAAAVAGALEAFDGIRRTTLPMKDSPAARALSVGHIRSKAPRESWR